MHPGLALQRAVYAALVADATLAALVGDRVFDAPPRAAAFPYVTLGEARATDWSTGTESGSEHRLVVHVWSRSRGKTECWAVLAALRTALDDADLAVDGHALVSLRVAAEDVAQERDGVTWRGTTRLRAVTEPT
jgi:hypothetical protein